jgi:DNA-binding NtrC family response regulator
MKQQILAVDDEPHMLRLLERIITEKTAYGIVTTQNSLEVPEILKNQSFDVIISDLKMPGKDGLDILRYLQENERDELVLIITAFGSLDSATEALSNGAFGYITKPFKKEQIIALLDRAMDIQFSRRESARLGRIFDLEPFDKATAAFEREYIRRLSERVGGQIERLADHSGLATDRLNKMLGELDED